MKRTAIRFTGVIALFAVFLAGCTSTQVITRFMEPEGRIDDQSILLLGEDVLVAMVDGYSVSEEAAHSGDTWNSYVDNRTIILIWPGERTILAAYAAFAREWVSAGSDTITLSMENSEGVTLKGNFLPSKCYIITAEKRGNTVNLTLREETDPDIVAKIKKDISGAKKPKEYVYSSLADISEPTLFEGTWVDVKSGGMVMTINGNTFAFYTPGTTNVVGRGKFTYTDTEITFIMKVQGKDFPAKNTYHFNDDGTLSLKTLDVEQILRKQ
jgi:hypothetical protein